MTQVMTVTGHVEAASLGHCQVHEHLFVARTPAGDSNPVLCIDDEALSAVELQDYAALGGDAVVDCQPVGAGRDLSALQHMSLASGVKIIAVTGYHLPGFYDADHWIFSDGKEVLRNRFISELTEGVAVGDSIVFPGAVKAAISKDGPSGRYETCLRAAAGAAAQAIVPLILHTECGVGAVEAVGICEQEGLDPARIAVCHVDRQATDYAPHEAVARTGAYLEYDTIARYKYHDDASEVALIRHMLELGYEDSLLLSLDTTSARLRSYGGTPGLGYILREFLSMLAEAGMTESQLHTITQVNPRLLFE